jgi:hypothetical protein
MNSSRSANRHMRGDSEGRLKSLRQGPRSVLVRVHPEYASSYAGQHLLQMTVNLLARQFEVVHDLILDVPDVPVLENIFPESITNSLGLCSRLLSLARVVAGPEIRVLSVSESQDTKPSCVVYVGSFDPSTSAVFCISAVAEGWRFDCATNRLTQAIPGLDSNPIGPYMAACFAAASIFRYFWQLDAQIDLSASLWGCGQGGWNDLAVGKNPTGKTIPKTYLIGCGAVGAAFAFTLAAITNLKGDIIAIDPQKCDVTNRNRLLSMSHNDTEDKAVLVRQLFTGRTLKVHPYVGPWPDYTADATRKVPDYIRQAEQSYRYETVLSCVDRNHHRRAIAAYLPQIAIGGSTQDFAAQVAIYSMRGECECLACNHPVPRIAPTEELRQFLVSMNTEQLNTWFDNHDADSRERAAIAEYLRDPSCGGVGQATLAKLGRDGEIDWSVGFVSVAAGVLLASVFIQTDLEGVDEIVHHGSECFAWFLKPLLGRSFAIRKPVCDVCGSENNQDIYNRLWTTASSTDSH